MNRAAYEQFSSHEPPSPPPPFPPPGSPGAGLRFRLSKNDHINLWLEV